MWDNNILKIFFIFYVVHGIDIVQKLEDWEENCIVSALPFNEAKVP